MRIAHIIETPGTGGAESVLVDIATRLPAEFDSVGVMMCESWTGAELAKRGFDVSVMPLSRTFEFQWPLRFAKFLRDQRIDAVQSHEFTANVYATVGARLAGVPIVCTLHGKNYWPLAYYRRAAYRWVSRTARGFVAVSTDLAKFASETLDLPAGRVRLIRNGIDVDRYAHDTEARGRIRTELGLGDAQSLLLACGELSEVKGHEWLLRAGAQVLAERPDSMIAIAGAGALQESLERLARSLGIAARVRLLGFRRDVPALLSACDVFVMPSLSEGLPLAILEAMAARVPVVATRVGGIPELIRPGDTGWLVPPRDSGAMADALLEVLADPDARLACAMAARDLCMREYSLAETVKKYAALYRGVDKPGS